MSTPMRVAAVCVCLIGSGTGWAAPSGAAGVDPALKGLPTVADLPAGAVQVSPVIPAMGSHWERPQDRPNGPIYCVIDGRIVCAEFAVSLQNLKGFKEFSDIQWPLQNGKRLPPLNHLDLNPEPHGHPGFTVPHYDIHMYFIAKAYLERLAPP